MRIVLTGNAGFIGSHIQDELISLGHEVYGIDDLSGGFKCNLNPGLKDFYEIDLNNPHFSSFKIIDKIKPEVLYHVAASAHEGGSFFDPVKIAKNNFMAYMNIFEECIKADSLQMVTCFSSLATYGTGDPPFAESDILKPVDPYGVNKFSMEEVTKQLSNCYGFKYSIVVPHNVFGARQSLNDNFRNVAGIFMNRIMRGEKIYIYGDGEQRRQFSYIKDALPCFIKMIDLQYHGQRINIGGTKDITVNQLLEIIIDQFHDYDIPEVIHSPDRHGEVKHAYCCPDKSIGLLGYREEYGIEKGIAEMADWAKKLGPKEWRKDKLAIYSDKWPDSWKEMGK